MKDLPLWTPLASLLLALSWLLPNASPPWIAFHKDAWHGGVLLLVMVVWLVRRRASGAIGSFHLDVFSGLLLVLAAMVVWQWWSGIVHFSGHALMGVLYFCGAALGIVFGRDWSKANPNQFGDFLFLSFLLAALGTSFLLMVQWLQLSWMGVWIQEVAPGHQPYGNLNQPNNAATLLVLGAVSLGWFAHRNRLGPNIWLIGCVYLAFMVAITGSRIGYLSFTSLTIGALVIGWSAQGFSPWRYRLLLLLCVFFITLLLMNLGGGVQSGVQTAASPRAFERDLTTARLFLWQAYLTTALTNPWTGFGFDQGFLTQLAAGGLGYDLRGLFTWSHNAFLDLATWFGLPVAVLAAALVAWVLWSVVRSPGQRDRWIHVAAIFSVVIHGMVELPMAFAYFLLPVCMMAGAVLVSIQAPQWPIPRMAVVAWTIVLGGLLAAVVYDYIRAESAFYTWRFEHARIGKEHPMDVPDTLVLNQFEAMLVGLRGTSASLSSGEVDAFEKAIVHVPSLAALQHLATLRMEQGDSMGAQRAADMAVIIAKPHMREAMAARWRYLSAVNPAFGAVEWKEDPGVGRARPE